MKESCYIITITNDIESVALPTESDSLDASSPSKLGNTLIHSASFASHRHIPSSYAKEKRRAMPPKGSTIHPPKPPADAPPTAASIQMKANSIGIGEYELPKTTLTKLAKGSVSRQSIGGWLGGKGG